MPISKILQDYKTAKYNKNNQGYNLKNRFQLNWIKS